MLSVFFFFKETILTEQQTNNKPSLLPPLWDDGGNKLLNVKASTGNYNKMRKLKNKKIKNKTHTMFTDASTMNF